MPRGGVVALWRSRVVGLVGAAGGTWVGVGGGVVIPRLGCMTMAIKHLQVVTV